MTKLNISMPEELLELIDSEASELGLSRSGLIQEASARYIAEAQADREAELLRLRGRRAARRMKEIGRQLGIAHADAVQLVAEGRAEAEAGLDE